MVMRKSFLALGAKTARTLGKPAGFPLWREGARLGAARIISADCGLAMKKRWKETGGAPGTIKRPSSKSISAMTLDLPAPRAPTFQTKSIFMIS
jgi:hypothetical protein